MTVKSLPKRPHGITAYLSVHHPQNAAAAIDFYVNAFCAEQTFRVDTVQGKVGHAELRIGDSVLMVADCSDDSTAAVKGAVAGSSHESPAVTKGAVALHLYVDNVDARFARILQGGAKKISAPRDHFYGDRSGTLRDPYGILWYIATHKEDLTAEEIRQRVDEELVGIGAHR